MTLTRLLIIDDEADICDLIADVAEGAGFEVKTETDPRRAEDVIRAFNPNCIMMDLMMPGVDGVELLRDLGDLIRSCQIILMSGHDARVLNSAKRLGAAHGLKIITTLEKPVDVATLRQTLDQLKTTSIAQVEKRQAVQNDEMQHKDLRMYYQPIVDMETGRVRGVEALARWLHPTHGVLGPDSFLGKLDAQGFNELAMVAIQHATRDMAVVQKSGFSLAVSINLTYSNLMDMAMKDVLLGACAAHQLPHERVTLEMTETDVMQDVAHCMTVLTQLRMTGFGLAIDDFGTGYSSLRELQRLPFSSMKMDKSFVMDMADSKANQTISNAIIDLGHNLGMKVVGEGVETAAVWKVLKERGCDYAQGYLISKPLALENLQKWLDGNKGVFSV